MPLFRTGVRTNSTSAGLAPTVLISSAVMAVCLAVLPSATAIQTHKPSMAKSDSLAPGQVEIAQSINSSKINYLIKNLRIALNVNKMIAGTDNQTAYAAKLQKALEEIGVHNASKIVTFRVQHPGSSSANPRFPLEKALAASVQLKGSNKKAIWPNAEKLVKALEELGVSNAEKIVQEMVLQ